VHITSAVLESLSRGGGALFFIHELACRIPALCYSRQACEGTAGCGAILDANDSR